MRNNEAYKGYVYQKKIAFRLLLNELSAQTGVIAFRMEHPNGDDFDLVYSDRLRIYQTKDVAKPKMPEYLIKMWRRYTENIKPSEKRQIDLGFIFSCNLDTNSYFKDLQKHKMSKRLLKLIKKVNKDKLTQVQIKDNAEWELFLKPITVEVHPSIKIEEEIDICLGHIFLQYRLSEQDRDCLTNEFLGSLDGVMQSGKNVSINEVNEVIDQWFIRNCESHPIIRKKIAAVFEAQFRRLSDIDNQSPSITGSESI